MDIQKDLGANYSSPTEFECHVFFLNKGKIIYEQTGPVIPNEPLEGVVFSTNQKKLKISRADTKFKVIKRGNAFFLEKI
ncbi:hypothetical protein QNI16_38070 [Cytophagaceae bacterium YF14B1]|uniref:Uncharacterized protein n=1 Tax=Xanthocytophaga flava TaxID=3048013 RepID=A0AAE3UE18_9BACT|nr:hypothetical protein [Xanthocytophaga flavus]MDJ1486349.1 hypothetical protein [Xanthocytophaga flavus]